MYNYTLHNSLYTHAKSWRYYRPDRAVAAMDGTHAATVDRDGETAEENGKESKQEMGGGEDGALPQVEKEAAIPTSILKPSASKEKDRNKWVHAEQLQ